MEFKNKTSNNQAKEFKHCSKNKIFEWFCE